MLNTAAKVAVLAGSMVLWLAGLLVFLRSELPARRKVAWVALLVVGGATIGLLLSPDALWRKFVLLVIILPILAALDVLLLRSKHGWLFWIRDGGFEVCTVLAAARAVRYLLDAVQIRPFLPP